MTLTGEQSLAPKVIQSAAESHSLATEQGLINYQLTRSYRRTLSIHIKQDQTVSVGAPLALPEQKIKNFILQKSPWIVKKIKESREFHSQVSSKKFDHGGEFLFLGGKHKLVVQEGFSSQIKVSFDGTQWIVWLKKETPALERQRMIRHHLIEWYRVQAKEMLGSRLFHFSRYMGLEPLDIKVKNQKSLWGSCVIHSKTINLNWQIIMAPQEVIDYVIVHELSHLKHPNHSKRFWALVGKYHPSYKKCKKWFKDHLAELTLPAA